MDSSGSLAREYNKEKQFLKSVAEKFQISESGTRAGVVTFSSRTEHSIRLNDHFDTASFNTAVDNIPLMGLQTRIDLALRLAQKELFREENGARSDRPKVLILLTDGEQTTIDGYEDPRIPAEEIRASGVRLLVVGIGQGVNKNDLRDIAGHERNVYTVSSFDDLIDGDFVDKLQSGSCKREEGK